MTENIPDRNKTALTQNVTRQAALWLDSKGFKPVETEVCVEWRSKKAWIADVAGVISPTQTELINLKLIRRPPRNDWVRRDDAAYQARFKILWGEWNDDYSKIAGMLTALIEVKTTVSDFRRDEKWGCENFSATNLRFIAMPAGLIPEERWPDDWGILLYGSAQMPLDGQSDSPAFRCVRPSPLFPISLEQSRDVILQLAIRRDHQTRYEHLRKLNQEIRISDAERISIDRVSTAIRFVLRVANGDSIEEAQKWAALRCNLPPYIVENLGAFQASIQKLRGEAAAAV
jgi:hypothetical protein